MTNVQVPKLIFRDFFVSIFLKYLSLFGRKTLCVLEGSISDLAFLEYKSEYANYSSFTRLCLLYMCSQGFIRVQLILMQENYHILDGSLLLHSSYKMGKMYLEPEESSPFAFC